MNVATNSKAAAKAIPFDNALLDRLLDEAGIDVLIASSKHNIQYLLGGYRFFFFDYADAAGNSRYLPLLIYPKGHAERASYVGHPLEGYEHELDRFWMPTVETRSRGTLSAMQLAVEHLKKLGPGARSIGVERGFLPADAESALREAMPDVKIVDAWSPLDRLRAIKTPDELAKLKKASELVVGAMLAVMGGHGPGVTTRQLVEALRTEETKRGLTFEYCLITANRSFNRAPSDQTWDAGEILSLDSGGNLGGYIGDLCRMAIHGEPDSELVDLLGEIDTIQMAARKPLRRGATGTDLYRHAMDALNASPSAAHLKFEAHGMGLVPHEAPRLTYTREDLDKPLEPGMVLSIETTMHHPKRGFIKLEDTVAVTENGWEGFGDAGRGWNRGGA